MDKNERPDMELGLKAGRILLKRDDMLTYSFKWCTSVRDHFGQLSITLKQLEKYATIDEALSDLTGKGFKPTTADYIHHYPESDLAELRDYLRGAERGLEYLNKLFAAEYERRKALQKAVEPFEGS